MPGLRVCLKCFTMIERKRRPKACSQKVAGGQVCGGEVFAPPGLAPWRLNTQDRKFLRSMRIAVDDQGALSLGDQDPGVRRA